MQITIPTQHLKSAAKTAAKLIGKESIRPILSNVLITVLPDHLQLTSSNTIESAEITINSKSVSMGACTVSAKMLSEIMGVVSGTETKLLLEENGTLIITSENSKFQLPTIPASEYPCLAKDFKPDWSEVIDGEVMAGYLKKVLVCEGDDSLKASYKAVCVESNGATETKITYASTDAKRLTVIETCASKKIEKGQWIVPQAFMRKVLDLCGTEQLTINVSHNQFQATDGTTTLTGRLIDESFPNWRAILPTSFSKKWTIKKSDLVSAIKSLSPISKEEDNVIRLSFKQQGLSLSAISRNHGSAKLFISATGNLDWNKESFEFGANSKFLIQALAASESESITLEANSAMLPILLTANQDIGWKYVIMPVLLEE